VKDWEAALEYQRQKTPLPEEGGEVDLRKRRRVMLAELYKLHSGLKDKQLRVRGRVALLSITIAL